MPRECGCRWHEGNRPKYDQGNEEKWAILAMMLLLVPLGYPRKKDEASDSGTLREAAEPWTGWHDHSRPDVESRSPLQASYGARV